MGFLYSIILIKQRPDWAGQKLTTPQRFPDYRWAAAGHFIGFIFTITILPSRYTRHTLQHYRLTNSLSNKNTVWDVKFRFHLWDYQKGSLCWWFIRIKVQAGQTFTWYGTWDLRATQRLIIDFISSSQQSVGVGVVCPCPCPLVVRCCNYSQLKLHNAQSWYAAAGCSRLAGLISLPRADI